MVFAIGLLIGLAGLYLAGTSNLTCQPKPNGFFLPCSGEQYIKTIVPLMVAIASAAGLVLSFLGKPPGTRGGEENTTGQNPQSLGHP